MAYRSSHPNDSLLDDLIRNSSPTRVTYPNNYINDTPALRLSHGSPNRLLNSQPPIVNSSLITPAATTTYPINPILGTSTLPPPAGSYLHQQEHVIVRDSSPYTSYAHPSIEHQMRIEDAKRAALPFIQPARTVHVETVHRSAPVMHSTIVERPSQTQYHIMPEELITHEYIKTHGQQEQPNLDCDDPELIKWIINENNHLSGRKNTPYDIHELLNHADHRVRESRHNQIMLQNEGERGSASGMLKSSASPDGSSPSRLVVVDHRGSAIPTQDVEIITHEEWPKRRQEVQRMRDYQLSDDEDDMSNFCGLLVSGKGKSTPQEQQQRMVQQNKIIVLK